MKATFANTDNVLWPGLSVSTRLLIDTLKQVIVVPEDAVQRGPNGLYVFVVSGEQQGRDAGNVKVGQEGSGQSVILQGLSPGERVVIAGQYRLQRGVLVEPTEAVLRSPGEIDAKRCRQDALIMEGGISAPFIRHPIATSLLMVGILFVGIVAYPQIAGSAFAAGRFPDHSGFGATSRRQPRHHGFRRGPATRNAIRADFRRRADDLDKHAWLDCDHHPVRSRPQHRRRPRTTCRRRSTPPEGNCQRICRPRRLTAR